MHAEAGAGKGEDHWADKVVLNRVVGGSGVATQ